MEEALTAKIKVLESNYFFQQREHSKLIKGLHEEIEKLQRKYSELAFDYTIRSNKSLETLLLEDKIKQLQSSINEKNKEIDSQKENLSIVQARSQEKEINLLKQIEEQKNTIKSLREIISERNGSRNEPDIISEKDEKTRKETQTEKIHKRRKKKSANASTNESGNSFNRAVERAPCQEVKTPKAKSATASSATSPLDKMNNISSEHNNVPKKGKRDKRNRKKNSAPPIYTGDIPILPSDYRAVVATLPPLSQSHEKTKLECDMHKFIPCSSGRHSSFSNMKGDVSTLSQLHKGLRKPSLKVEGFN
ncbi:coiled-coil domain-containing protein 92-like [Hetaerina americana]|uniref:coiled-coil domain-containing protein 92-like n=1 Tax=Hetaerina americana TaxID=62018 RepID=UPI003A7F22EA